MTTEHRNRLPADADFTSGVDSLLEDLKRFEKKPFERLDDILKAIRTIDADTAQREERAREFTSSMDKALGEILPKFKQEGKNVSQLTLYGSVDLVTSLDDDGNVRSMRLSQSTDFGEVEIGMDIMQTAEGPRFQSIDLVIVSVDERDESARSAADVVRKGDELAWELEETKFSRGIIKMSGEEAGR